VSNFLTMNSVIQCPHGGTVTAVPSNAKAKAQGGLILCASDVFTVAGCAFVQNPCVTVTWPGAVHKSMVSGVVALTSSDTGLCNSGSTVIITSTQSQSGGS
jgi:hypothetical protein